MSVRVDDGFFKVLKAVSTTAPHRHQEGISGQKSGVCGGGCASKV